MSGPVCGSFHLNLIYINVVLYALCFQLQRPVEPFMVEQLGINSDSSGEYARLQSFFSIMQMMGSLCFGILLDRLGSKGGFILSFVASALCYTLIAHADSIFMLYMSKIPTIFQGGFLCAQAAVAEFTPDGEERVRALGRLTVAYTVGSVIGPALGGYLGSAGNYYIGANVAVAGSLLSILLCLLMPTSSAEQRNDDSKPETGSRSNFDGIMGVVKSVWPLLCAKTITSVGNSMAAATLPLVLKNTYGFNEQGLGTSMSVISGFNALVNGVLLAPIVAFHGGGLVRVIRNCLIGMTLLYLLQFIVVGAILDGMPLILSGAYPFLVTCVFLSMHQYVLSTVITAESTALVDESAKGTLLGLEHSLFAAARIVSPQLGVLILQAAGIQGVSGACCGVFFLYTSGGR